MRAEPPTGTKRSRITKTALPATKASRARPTHRARRLHQPFFALPIGPPAAHAGGLPHSIVFRSRASRKAGEEPPPPAQGLHLRLGLHVLGTDVEGDHETVAALELEGLVPLPEGLHLV